MGYRFSYLWASAAIQLGDNAADYRAPMNQVLTPKTWARQQGIPLSWVDRDRGIIRPDE